MKSKAIQCFSDDYLKRFKELSTEQILSFLEDFRQLHGRVDIHRETKLIDEKIHDIANFSKVKKNHKN